jgi:hypothetical protein
VRITGRIPKEVPILLIGSDLDGKVFSEPTNTVLLSLHGAGIVSHHELSPEQELILRCPDRNSETAVRIVGEMGSSNGIHTYGLAFVDPNLNFWSVEFPPLSRAAVLTMPLPPVQEPDAPRKERRQHPRAKVNYTALVRHPERGDDIVLCEDMSRGGLRFKSKKSYYERSLIEIAVPYVVGQISIFIPAQIISVVELPEEKLFRCGVAFLQPAKRLNQF